MNCDQTRMLLHPYLDGELDVVESLRIVEHLRECTACEHEQTQLQELSKLLARAELRRPAPSALEERIRSAITKSERPQQLADGLFDDGHLTQRRWRRFSIIAGTVAALALVAVLGFWASRANWRGASSQELLASDVTEAHIRSLMANHLLDVPSSDRHTVKPWFIGKLDFAPPVVDLGDRGFTLAGGRLDVLELQPVAAMVYRRGQHVINVFVWPSADSGPTQMAELTRRGYSMLHWTAAGRVCWVVSDLNAADLHEFATIFRQRLEQPAGR
jgi:anti-sigma factor RsiW